MTAAAALSALDHWRSGLGPRGEAAPDHKEWSHFSVLPPGLDLLVNFSLVGGGGLPTEPRLAVLCRDAEGWDGDVETFAPGDCRLEAGGADARFGPNAARLAGGRYRLEVALARRPVRLSLDLAPVTRPVLANRVRLAPGETMRWLAVPHLRASGEVEIAGRRHAVADAPAYHDRNWGDFAFGGDHAWDWAALTPVAADAGWSLVYSRMSDRARAATLDSSLILYRGPDLHRKLFGADVRATHHGLLRPERPLVVPRVLGLVLDPAAVDVPERIAIEASGFGTELSVEIRLHDHARIATPNDRGLGLTALCEAGGTARVRGRVDGEPVAFEARVQAEFNSAVA